MGCHFQKVAPHVAFGSYCFYLFVETGSVTTLVQGLAPNRRISFRQASRRPHSVSFRNVRPPWAYKNTLADSRAWYGFACSVFLTV